MPFCLTLKQTLFDLALLDAFIKIALELHYWLVPVVLLVVELNISAESKATTTRTDCCCYWSGDRECVSLYDGN